MRGKAKTGENPELSQSFSKENREMDQQSQRLQIEILRVHTIEKQRALFNIWNMDQQQLCEFFTNYPLFPQDHMNLPELLESNRLKLIKSEGKIYFGLIDMKKRQGKGVNISKDGKIYEGEFNSNEKNGRAIQIYANGNLYIGEFMNNKKHGDGTFYWFSMSSKNPKSDEYVEYYQGEWWGGLPDGFGVHQKINGDSYTGVFKNGLKHGEGTQFYGNGDYYKGEFVNGMPEGYGEYIWTDESSFKGDFKQGFRNGYGVWTASKNRIESYKGHYVMDKKSGHGLYQWDNGWVYKGNFDNDSRNGYGQLYNGEGELTYRGFWENGQQIEKQVVFSNRDKNINFRSIQHTRYESQREPKGDRIDIFDSRSKSSAKAHNHKEENYADIPNAGEYNLGPRPQTHSGNVRIKRSCTNGKSSNSQKWSESAREPTKGSIISKALIGTIKSNLFVPFRMDSNRK